MLIPDVSEYKDKPSDREDLAKIIMDHMVANRFPFLLTVTLTLTLIEAMGRPRDRAQNHDRPDPDPDSRS